MRSLFFGCWSFGRSVLSYSKMYLCLEMLEWVGISRWRLQSVTLQDWLSVSPFRSPHIHCKWTRFLLVSEVPCMRQTPTSMQFVHLCESAPDGRQVAWRSVWVPRVWCFFLSRDWPLNPTEGHLWHPAMRVHTGGQSGDKLLPPRLYRLRDFGKGGTGVAVTINLISHPR